VGSERPKEPPYGSLAVPQWLYQTYSDVALWNPRGGDPKWYTLNFLSTNYQAKYREFINAFADWLAANPDVASNVAWVEMGVGLYSETQPSDYWTTAGWADYVFYNDPPPYGLGWTAADWERYVDWCIDTYYNAFRVRNNLSSIALLLNCAPDYPSHSGYSGPTTRTNVTNYAAVKEIGLKNNGLQVDRSPWWLYQPLATWGSVVATKTVPIGWETYEQWLTNESDLYWGMLSALDKHPDIIEPDRWLMVNHSYQARTNYLAIWNWVEQYLGVTPATTPGVWIAMRNSKSYNEVTKSGNGEPDDYSFWLFEKQTVAGGDTVPEFNVTSAKEGRFTRRTDQATGNPYMWLWIYDGVVNGNPNRDPFVLEVTYLDRGTDRWRLTYDSFTGEKEAFVIQKTNTDTWKKKTVTLTDARFGNGLGPSGANCDLKIDCMNDGDEYIHMVEIKKTGSGPTPTPTQTPLACSIQGSVTLQGRPSPPNARWSVPLTVTVGGVPYVVTTDESGNFSVTGLLAGIYDISVKNAHTLSNVRYNYTLVNGVNTISMGEMKEGDASGDDRVNSSDFLLLRSSYFKTVGQPGFVDGADFNEDDVVNSSDFLLLRTNYFQNGPIVLSGQPPTASKSSSQAAIRPGVAAQSATSSLSMTQPSARALAAVTIAISPQLTTVNVGDSFDLDVWIDAGAEEVAAADVYLDFDPNVLEVIEIRDGQGLSIFARLHDNATGIVDIGAGNLGAPVTGSFVLATLHMRAKEVPPGRTTSVSFSLTAPRQTLVKNVSDQNLLGTAADGQVNIHDFMSTHAIYLPCIKRH
jgi:hypothetical protein